MSRAMAADPPILLMDEPFGAVDPITRARLQNEFLRIQERMHKTIVFVTHDIDEAIKMGNTIAVMDEGVLVQHSTPSELLSQPADDFVANLVGRNRSIKRLHLIRCRDIIKELEPPVSLATPKRELQDRIDRSEIGAVMVVNGDS